MKPDKAILKVLKSQEIPELTPGFNTRMMNRVHVVVEKKKKRQYVQMLCFLAAVSLGLISMAVYFLKDYLPSHFTFYMPDFNIHLASLSRYGFGFYIAFLTLLLVGLDHYFRSVRQKRKHGKFNLNGDSKAH